MVNSLRKVDFSHPTGHYTRKKFRPPPLEKILGAPLQVINSSDFFSSDSRLKTFIGVIHIKDVAIATLR